MPSSSVPRSAQVRPPSALQLQPASRKFEAMLSNCRQPIAIRSGALESTAIEGSLAASPTMLLPSDETLTWTLTNPLRSTFAGGPSLAAASGSGTGGWSIRSVDWGGSRSELSGAGPAGPSASSAGAANVTATVRRSAVLIMVSPFRSAQASPGTDTAPRQNTRPPASWLQLPTCVNLRHRLRRGEPCFALTARWNAGSVGGRTSSVHPDFGRVGESAGEAAMHGPIAVRGWARKEARP